MKVQGEGCRAESCELRTPVSERPSSCRCLPSWTILLSVPMSHGMAAITPETGAPPKAPHVSRPLLYTLNPTPYTPHPTPHTLHPTPYTPNPAQHTPHPTPQTLHPTPHTLHPTLYTLDPTPYTPPRILACAREGGCGFTCPRDNAAVNVSRRLQHSHVGDNVRVHGQLRPSCVDMYIAYRF